VAKYYLGENVRDINEIDLDTVLHDGKSVWFVEDFGVDQVMGNTFAGWAEINCDLVGDWDQYTAGRNWKMRLHLCQPTKVDNSYSLK
jgi:hypothetical protein